MDDEERADEADRLDRRAGCLTGLVLWIVIGVPLFVLNAAGECARDTPSAAVCDAGKQWVGWFSVFGSPVAFALLGYLVYRVRKRLR